MFAGGIKAVRTAFARPGNITQLVEYRIEDPTAVVRSHLFPQTTQRVKESKKVPDGHGYRHQFGGEKLYQCWHSMVQRCHKESNKVYSRYGGRGIIVVDEWRYNYVEFRNWAEMTGYNSDLILDRINNDGPYSPDNCRWTNNYVSQQNRRLIFKRNRSGYHGVTRPVRQKKWRAYIRSYGVSYNLGLYETPEEAALAYNNFVIAHGTHHPLNPIPNKTSE